MDMFLNDMDVYPPPPLHSWTIGIIHDLVVEIGPKVGECVSIGPGPALLFFGRLMEPREGIYLHEAQDLKQN